MRKTAAALGVTAALLAAPAVPAVADAPVQQTAAVSTVSHAKATAPQGVEDRVDDKKDDDGGSKKGLWGLLGLLGLLGVGGLFKKQKKDHNPRQGGPVGGTVNPSAGSHAPGNTANRPRGGEGPTSGRS